MDNIVHVTIDCIFMLPAGDTAANTESREADGSCKGAAAAGEKRDSKSRAARTATPARAEPEPEPPEPTEYARNRPRRDVQGPKAMLGHTTESLELVKCLDFVGPPGCGAPLAQPFQVNVHAQVCSASLPRPEDGMP